MRKVLIFIVLTLSAAVFAEDSIPALAPDTLAADTLATDSSEISTIHTSRSFSEGDKNYQLSTIYDAMPNVVVHQDSLISQLMDEKAFGKVGELIEVQGYRVQIYSSNHQQMAKLEAMRLEKDMQDKLDVPVYVSYTPPFWKVRIGDFATYEEAQEFKNGFIREFPELLGDTYVVRDQVVIKR